MYFLYRTLSVATLLVTVFSSLLSANLIAEPASSNPITDTTSITVFKSANCGCCGLWVDHIEQAKFTAQIKHPQNLATIKQQLGISPEHQSCHTSVIGNYVFEGHIPAEIVQHFLAMAPEHSKGLSVPGMPLGSPGMDARGDFRPYDVLLLKQDGSSVLYASVSSNEIIYSEDK
jgi:hypothetical protein